MANPEARMNYQIATWLKLAATQGNLEFPGPKGPVWGRVEAEPVPATWFQ